MRLVAGRIPLGATPQRGMNRKFTRTISDVGPEETDGLEGIGRRSTQLYPVILEGMKTAISLPDEIFEKVTHRAHDLGVSRSEFFSRAAIRYLDELDAASVTRQIDQAVDAQAQQDESARDAVAVGRHVLDDVSGDW